jgi:hypothetical protein
MFLPQRLTRRSGADHVEALVDDVAVVLDALKVER